VKNIVAKIINKCYNKLENKKGGIKMKINLPEKKRIKKRELIIYVSIMIVCVISIIIAFYVQFFARIDIRRLIGFDVQGEFSKKTEEQTELLKAELLLKLVNFNFEMDNIDLIINNPKEIIYILIKISYLLIETGAKEINIKAHNNEKTYIEITSDLNIDNVNIEEVELLQESENRVIIVDNNSINIKL